MTKVKHAASLINAVVMICYLGLVDARPSRPVLRIDQSLFVRLSEDISYQMLL